MSLNLCVDIDGTITEAFYWIDYANKYFGTDLKPHQVTRYDIHEVLNIPREAYQSFYDMHRNEIHGNAKPRKYAELVLWKLSHQHNMSYVTARSPEIMDVTKSWFEKHSLPKCSLHMLGSHYKVEKAKELNCDIFIEDRYENAVELALNGFKVLLMDCTYNRQPLLPGITRVTNWLDAYDEIETTRLENKRKYIEIA